MIILEVNRSAYFFGARTFPNGAAGPISLSVGSTANQERFIGAAIHPDSEVRGVDLVSNNVDARIIEGQPYRGAIRVSPQTVLQLEGLDHTDGTLLVQLAETEADLASLADTNIIRDSAEVTLTNEVTTVEKNVLVMCPRREASPARQISVQLQNAGIAVVMEVYSQVWPLRGTGAPIINQQLLGNLVVAAGANLSLLAFDAPGNVIRFRFIATALSGPVSGVLRVGPA